ncbi:MAG: sugar ABC transporter ATP-binding protein, partial [Acetobacteraceae bacterium]
MPALIEVEALSKSFGSTHALQGVTFACGRGEIHGLVGENGAGKSTLLKILAGVFPPDSGEIRLQGERIRMFDPGQAARLGIAIIYQEFSLIPALTVAENIHVGREPKRRFGRLDRARMREAAGRVLTRLGLTVDPDRRIDTLTVAEQQAVEIARALAVNAKLLILDEPTAALAEREADRLMQILADARSGGTSIIFVSHRLHEVLQIADVVTVLKDGRVMATESTAAFTEPRLISLMVGRELAHTFPPRHPLPVREVALEAEHLSAGDGSFADISLTLYRREILGIAGLEGHGQRELLRALFGLEPIRLGEIRVGGKRLSRPLPGRCIKRGIAFVSDDR